MREIKFRAFIKELNEIREVEYINFLKKMISFPNKFCKEYYLNADFDEIELMQYTGLKDKNNKEIYEGDILFESFGEKYYKVVFENGSFRAEFEGDFEEHSFDLIDVVAQGCEIVGNIYENPELLGGQ